MSGFRIDIAVGVDILPEQGYLLEAVVVQIHYFCQNAVRFAGAFTSSCVRHNAVRAEIIASAHNAHKPGNAV